MKYLYVINLLASLAAVAVAVWAVSRRIPTLDEAAEYTTSRILRNVERMEKEDY